jgi:hypothetical protein
MAGRLHKGLVGLVAAGVLASALMSAGSASGAVTSAAVKGAIERAIAYLRQTQHPDGSWPDNGHRGGCTALAVLGLLHAGLPTNDPAVARGLTAVCNIPNEATYVVSLKAQALAVANEPQYAGDLKAATDWLAETQCPTGMWGYGNRLGRLAAMGRGDNSNTQFALLGLHEAAKVGMKVPESVWQNARRHFVADQCPDGGWGYTNERTGYGSMTAAGVASLYIVGQRLDVGGPKVFTNGAYPSCGSYRQNVVLAAGLKWLADNFSVNENPGKGRTWLHYYLYGLERVGMVSGMRNFGRHDWYREGAETLVESQNHNGAWGGGVYDTVFGLLFLSKGNRPVLVQKLKWKGLREPSWNRNIHDLENLTAFIDDKFGKRVTWQSTTLELPLQELRVGPVLLITGHEFPVFTAEEKAKLREFVESGGTLLCEACCGAGAYAEGFRLFAAETFPEYRLHALDKAHPVFKSYFQIDDLYDLEGIDVGCRTGVFFSPKALDCLWELQTIPKSSEQAFRLGTNICAYATGKELLQDKLDVVELPAHQKDAEVTEVPRGATRIARLIHDGDYKADVHAEVRLAEMLRDQAKVDVVAQGRYLRANDEKLFEYPVVLMIGHYSFTPSDEEVAGLRAYLDHGGCLVAEACCGRLAFDKSFRQLAARLYPASALEPLAANHPIYSGQVGTQLGELHYRRILADELNSRGTASPPLEAVTVKGRTLIIYSKYDWSCCLEGDNPFSCRGYLDADGRKLALNIFLYAISY